jgi:rare lipoprotein A (peptidoglycan hydrolase)
MFDDLLRRVGDAKLEAGSRSAGFSITRQRMTGRPGALPPETPELCSMRSIFKAMLAMLPVTIFMATGASAATESWRHACVGPEHACSSPAAAPAQKYKATASKSKSSVNKNVADSDSAKPKAKAKSKFTSVKSKKPVAVAEDDDKPVKAKKKAKAVAKADDDEPVAKPKKKAKVAAKSDDDDEAPQKKSKGSGGSAFQSGMASWYGGNFHGRKTANGETYDMWDMTAAHKTLPFGTRVRVTNTRSGDSVTVRINDRGPFVGGRIIDLSAAAAGDIGMTNTGVAPVKLTILGKG